MGWIFWMVVSPRDMGVHVCLDPPDYMVLLGGCYFLWIGYRQMFADLEYMVLVDLYRKL